MNFITKHYNGDYSLGRSFWINPYLFQAPLGIVLGIFEADIPEGLAVAALMLNASWIWVGVWRSANKHVERGGKPAYVRVVRTLSVMALIAIPPFVIGGVLMAIYH